MTLAAPRAILLDLDGTLVDTVDLRIRAWEVAFGEAGIEADPAFLAPLMGSDGRWLAGEVARAAGRNLTDEDAEQLDRRSGEAFSELNVDPRPLPGVTELLRDLDVRRIPWVIATSSRPDQVAASVDSLDLLRSPRIVDASHVKLAKPAPDLLLAGAEQLAVDPTGCWYVGDSTWDMQAARAAQMAAVGVATGASDAATLRSAGAYAVYPAISELHEELIQVLLERQPD